MRSLVDFCRIFVCFSGIVGETQSRYAGTSLFGSLSHSHTHTHTHTHTTHREECVGLRSQHSCFKEPLVVAMTELCLKWLLGAETQLRFHPECLITFASTKQLLDI